MAYEWITEENLKEIDTLISELKTNPNAAAMIKRIQDGTATYAEVSELASRSGRAVGKIISKSLVDNATDGRVSEDIARAAIVKPLKRNYEYVADAAEQVQESLNQEAGLNLKAVKPEFNLDRAEGLVKETVNRDDMASFAGTLTQQIENASMSVSDDFVKANAEAHYNAGLSPKIERVADPKCCAWCSGLAGTYEYSRVNNTGNDVFRRHNNCRCKVLYDPGNGKKWQDAHSKRLLSAAESAKIKARKTAGLDEERKTPEQRVAEAERLVSINTSIKDNTTYKALPDTVFSGHSSAPKNGIPNSIVDHLGNDGKTETRTFYGDDGYKKKDVTTHDHGNPKRHPYGKHGEHAHDYEWNPEGSLKQRKTRDLTDQEREENSDIL